jgi:hypothetical protein
LVMLQSSSGVLMIRRKGGGKASAWLYGLDSSLSHLLFFRG